MRGREDVHFGFFADDLAGERVQGVDSFNFVAKELDTDRVFFVHGDDFDGIATDAEGAAVEV